MAIFASVELLLSSHDRYEPISITVTAGTIDTIGIGVKIVLESNPLVLQDKETIQKSLQRTATTVFLQ